MPVDANLEPAAANTDRVRLRHELRDLFEEVADLLDDDRIEEFPGYFTEDCLYKVTSRENYREGLAAGLMFCDGIGMLRDRVLALRETQIYEPRMWRHFISGVHVLQVDGDTVRARANFLVTESLSDAHPSLFLVGQYLDTVVRRGGRWLFQERIAVCDNHHIRRSLIVPV